jgi:starch phosphorylase
MSNQITKKNDFVIAYFSMEIALESDIKTYAGGLGVLAGDTLKSAADLRLDMVGVTLLNNKGYFKQKIDENGNQQELPVSYNFSKLEKLKNKVSINIGQDKVWVGVWRYFIKSHQVYQIQFIY